MRLLKISMACLFTLLAATCLPTATFARTVNLLDTPADNSKVTGTIDLATGVIIIYVPKEGNWMKVGSPTTGNTGWIKSTDLTDASSNTIKVQQNVAEDQKGNKTQSVNVTIGNNQLTPEQKKAMDQTMQQRQKVATDSLKLMEQSLQQMNKIYQQQVEIMQKAGFPAIPGLTPPVKANTAAPAPTVQPAKPDKKPPVAAPVTK